MIEISDLDELRVIHRVIMEAKFSGSPSDNALLASPILSDFANRVLNLIIQIEKESFENDVSTEEWRSMSPDRKEWSIVLNRVDGVTWSALSKNVRENIVYQLFSPFTLSDDMKTEFLCQMEKAENDVSEK